MLFMRKDRRKNYVLLYINNSTIALGYDIINPHHNNKPFIVGEGDIFGK